jgi:protein-tyrosine phosphatase
MDLTAEFSETKGVRNLRYGGFFLMDARPGTLESLERSMAWIDEARLRGPVLVHCALGHGRSAMVVAAYLIHIGEAHDAESALEQVRQRRPGIELRSDQVRLLTRFSEKFLKSV